MQPEFYRIGDAINNTMAFYKIDKIKDHMLIFAGKDPNSGYKLEWYDLVFELQGRMEKEILQTIYTCNHNTQSYLFENLKNWLQDDRVSNTNILRVISEIESYNKRILDQFEIKVQQDIEKHRSTPEFLRYNHLESYETEKPDISMSIFFRNWEKKIRTEINYKYYCIKDIPELLDTTYIPDYINLLNKLISNFRGIISKYVKMYDEGKIKAHDVIVIEKPILPATIQAQPKLELPSPESKKIKAKLTIPQLAYLFKMLNDSGIIEAQSLTEIHDFISKNFTVPSKVDGEDISTGKLKRLWSSFDTQVAAFWSGKFIELHNLSKKDNPNNIKHK